MHIGRGGMPVKKRKPARVKKYAKKKAPKKKVAKKKHPRCSAKTKAGKRCKNYAAGRSKYCASHK